MSGHGRGQVMNTEAGMVLEARGVARHFVEGGVRLEVLRGLELAVRAGERLGIIGASGSGKTTLLQLSLIHI